MAYTLPVFNITCNIWHDQAAAPQSYLLPDLTAVACNLALGRRRLIEANGNISGTMHMQLLLPALTDVRPGYNGALGGDLVEAPAGSKRFYLVLAVDDIGKGFANEHRIAMLVYQPNGVTFVVTGAIPAPIPLP